MLTYLVDALESTGFPDVTQVDLTDRLNMQIVYQDRLLIQLGSEADLEYKLQFVTYALENSVEEGFEGILDASIPKELHILPKSITEEPAEESLEESTEESGESSSSQAAPESQPEGEGASGAQEEDASQPSSSSGE